MTDTIEYNGEAYQNIGGEWYDANFIRVPLALAKELDGLARARRDPAPLKARKKRTRSPSGGSSEDSAFSHADVFPIIAELIRELNAGRDNFIPHREIVPALLAHPEGRGYIDSAVKQKGHKASDWANWMVQWFSTAITTGDSPFRDDFERERQDGRWAYRPLESE